MDSNNKTNFFPDSEYAKLSGLEPLPDFFIIIINFLHKVLHQSSEHKFKNFNPRTMC